MWRLFIAVFRRLFFFKSTTSERFADKEDFGTLLNKQTGQKVDVDTSKPKILLTGPYHFKKPMWSIRASATIPDLIAPLNDIAEVHLLTPIPNSDIAPSLNKLVEENNIYHHLLPPSFNLMSMSEKNVVLDSIVELIKPSVIMNTFGVIISGFDTVICAKRNGIKSVLRVPGNEVRAHKKMISNPSDKEISQNNFYSRKVDFTISNADKVMVMSKNEALRIIGKRQSDEGVFLQIRGVDTDVFRPKANKNMYKKDPINVGFIGRLTLEKGTDIFLEMIDRFANNPNVIFHIISPETIKDKARFKNKNLIWHGFLEHEKMPMLMKELDVLILPSYTEGLSQSMVEAMSCGLPVLLQAHVHSECLPGMIHCSGDAETFVEALNELVSDREKLTRLSVAARQYAINHFDKKIWADKMTEAFQQLLKE